MDKRIEVLRMIAKNMENMEDDDAMNFNGRTIAKYFGHHRAATNALAGIMISLIEEKEE